jgi:hypothetical protein
MNLQTTECTLYFSYDASVLFFCNFRKHLLMQWKGLALKQGTEHFLCNLPKNAMLSLFCPLEKT